MTERLPYCSIAFVSGKGGVGKTTLAVNVAELVSRSKAKTLILDLDVHNLGATGLLRKYWSPRSSDTVTLLSNERSEREIFLAGIDEHMFFIPGRVKELDEAPTDSGLNDPDVLCDRLCGLFRELHDTHGIDCFILDCHGGIDATSVGAAKACDFTLVVTEADTVTFAGTLGLVDTYYSHQGDRDGQIRLEYIVNRMPSRYRFRDLDRMYRDLLSRRMGRYTGSGSILSYIPAEGYVAETFGNYPFQVRLEPNSVFSRKLELLVLKLLEGSFPTLVSGVSRKVRRKRRLREKIQRIVKSDETRNVETVVHVFAFNCGCMLLSACIVLGGVVFSFSGSKHSSWVVAPLIVLSCAVGVYSFKALRRLANYFSGKSRLIKRMLRGAGAGERLGLYTSLWKVRILHIATAVAAALLFLYFVFAVVAACVVWVGASVGDGP